MRNAPDSYDMHNTGHSLLEKITIFIFVVSLGLGEVIEIGSIKLSYITSIAYMLVMLSNTGWRIKLTVENQRYNQLLKFCYVWIIYALIQIIWVQDLELYTSFIRTLVINIVVIYFITTYVNAFEDWLLVLHSFIVLIAISLMVGRWEIITGGHVVKLTGEINLMYYSHRPVAFYGNGNDYATVLVFGIFASLLYLFCGKRNFFSISVLALISLESIFQIITIDCRGALYSLYLIAGLLIVLNVANKWSANSENNERVISAILLVTSISATILIFSKYSPDELIGKYSSDGNYGSDMGRLEMIKGGCAALIESLGFGVGAGQSILLYNINLHFFYLEILVEYGLFVGGYLVGQFFKLIFCRAKNLDNFCKAVIQTYPIVLILVGVSSSGMTRIRPTWILFTLIYTLAYGKFDNL